MCQTADRYHVVIVRSSSNNYSKKLVYCGVRTIQHEKVQKLNTQAFTILHNYHRSYYMIESKKTLSQLSFSCSHPLIVAEKLLVVGSSR